MSDSLCPRTDFSRGTYRELKAILEEIPDDCLDKPLFATRESKISTSEMVSVIRHRMVRSFDQSEASDSLDLDVRNSEQITCFCILEIEVPVLFVFTGLRLVVASSWLLILIEEAYYIRSVYSEYSSSICSMS